MRVALLSGPAINTRHGSGVQLLRIFEGLDVQPWHLYWKSTAGYRSDCGKAMMLSHLPRLKRLRGGRAIELFERALGVAWWRGEQVSADRLRRQLARRRWACDVAYLSVASESEAREAMSIVRALGCPYVVHMMDLCHDGGIDPATMSGYRELLRGAASVLVVSEPMLEEVRKVRCEDVELVSIAKAPTPPATEPPNPSGSYRIVMIGSLGGGDNPALGVLADALEILRPRWPGLQCVYMGQSEHLLPERLRRRVTLPRPADLGAFDRELRACHLAYLPVPMRLDCYGRFAPVGRLTDYLMAGLPVAYCIARGSAPKRMLDSFEPEAARRVETAGQLAEAAAYFADSDRWRAANQRLRAYAESHCAIEALRDTVRGALERATGSRLRSSAQ